MRVLDRYIVAALCGRIALALLVLLVLAALFLFVNEQGWVGVGRYGQVQALAHVAANLPGTALQFLPVAALLGTLLGLGELARGSELTVMRASGVPVSRIASAVAFTGVLLLPLAFAIAEWVAPPLAQSARATRALARDESLSLSGGAAWVREGDQLLRAGPDGDLTLYQLQGTRLTAITTAGRSQRQPDGSRLLQDVLRTDLDDRGATRTRQPQQILGAGAGQDFFSAAMRDPRQQSLTARWQAIRALQARGQQATAPRFALWSAVAGLMATPLAMLLAVPMVLGFLRTSGSGAKASLALVLGLLYFLAQRTVENGTLAFGLHPVLLAWLPTLVLALVVALLLWRTRTLSAA